MIVALTVRPVLPSTDGSSHGTTLIGVQPA